MAKLRILCLCAGGVVRSVTMAALLKVYWKLDALSAGFMNTDGTVEYLLKWADHVYVMQPYMYEQVPEKYRYKTRVMDVGEDVWGMSQHPDLIRKLYPMLEKEFGPDRRVESMETREGKRKLALIAKREKLHMKRVARLF